MLANLQRRSERLFGRDDNLCIESIASEIAGCGVFFYWSLAVKVRVLRRAGRHLEWVHTILMTSRRRWSYACVLLWRGDLTRSLDIDRIEIARVELGLRLIRLVELIGEAVEIGDCSIEIYKVRSEGIWSREGVLHMGSTVGKFAGLLRRVGDSMVIVRRDLLLVMACGILRSSPL